MIFETIVPIFNPSPNLPVILDGEALELPGESFGDASALTVDPPSITPETGASSVAVAVFKQSEVENSAPDIVSTIELVERVDCETLWFQVSRQLNAERLSKFLAGMILFRLQEIYGKAGHGTFVKRAKTFAKDWGISLSTVYQRIAFYKEVQKGREEILLVCITADQWAKWGDFDDADAFDRAAEEAASDAQVARMNGLITAAEEQVKNAMTVADGKAPTKSLKLEGLDTDQRKKIQALLVQVIERKGGKAAFALWLFGVIVNEAKMILASAPKAEGEAANV